MMKKQVFNPYLPSWEYIPDGEPHVFGNRVYIYGSHDFFNGHVFCPGDYVCYSAPTDDLSDWRYEGVIYGRTTDPVNKQGKMCLYAPDVTKGPDGKYYLFYVLDKVGYVSVAVCNKPAGKYKFYGYVHYKDGIRLGERMGDMPQFDPAVLTENNKTYLYTAFCGNHMKDRIGVMATVLGKDMLTIEEEPVIMVPGDLYSSSDSKELEKAVQEINCPYKIDSENWKGFKGHEFFEASSIRKVNDTYYFVYSSIVMHELCYAVSKNPVTGFKYGGVIVSNCDMHIDTYKKADMPSCYGANNHGGFERINGEYYIFYHRHTNGTWYSRQGCAEKIKIEADGSIKQVEITSCGLNNGPLKAEGEYPAYIASNLFIENDPCPYVGSDKYAYITQEGRDGDKNTGFVANIKDQTIIGFKYFDFRNVRKITVSSRCYVYGHYEIRTKWDGPVLAVIKPDLSNVWEEYSAEVNIPDGVGALYLKYVGGGTGQLKSIRFN
ncbi:MAG: family 43 glycosylhydrolase [Treponema sp.]|nr:family 43 glycosylhydrolase [Treponema sp.]